ncbi:hypothetical protein PG913_01680 [Tenacibaculum pacificus]|uniref:hypothetical protein n=1 Tax=Tenacibaculum pacificus TaxID=3018314 RepID=UPI0022F40592|nr:hypothetical protein [Tenacibaculum pacificus]WBX73980.1 hypothetical protein PG913_01680 [Tenacibaculum pacificus]
MKKIEIILSDEQYLNIKNEIERCSKLNIEAGTLTGLSFKVSNYFAGISSLEFEMHKKIDLGDVDWEFTDS